METTEQNPVKCEHYLGVATCELEDELDLDATTTCVFFYGKTHCLDYQSKRKKNNENN